jgi:hypothetical protein
MFKYTMVIDPMHDSCFSEVSSVYHACLISFGHGILILMILIGYRYYTRLGIHSLQLFLLYNRLNKHTVIHILDLGNNELHLQVIHKDRPMTTLMLI